MYVIVLAIHADNTATLLPAYSFGGEGKNHASSAEGKQYLLLLSARQ
jgi:hypothetical protein